MTRGRQSAWASIAAKQRRDHTGGHVRRQDRTRSVNRGQHSTVRSLILVASHLGSQQRGAQSISEIGGAPAQVRSKCRAVGQRAETAPDIPVAHAPSNSGHRADAETGIVRLRADLTRANKDADRQPRDGQVDRRGLIRREIDCVEKYILFHKRKDAAIHAPATYPIRGISLARKDHRRRIDSVIRLVLLKTKSELLQIAGALNTPGSFSRRL